MRMASERSTNEKAGYQNPYSPPPVAQQQIPMFYIAVAIAMAIFGLILGKFIL